MVSAPPKKHLPALLLVAVGLFFCTIAVTGVTDSADVHTYSVTQVENNCSDSLTESYEFDRRSPDGQAFSSVTTHGFDGLSARGQAFFLEAIESGSVTITAQEAPPESSVGPGDASASPGDLEAIEREYVTTIAREAPPEFSVGAGDTSAEIQYIVKDGHCYKLGIRGPGGLGGLGTLIIKMTQFIGGGGLAVIGATSYKTSRALLPSVLLGGSAVFVISPLLWIGGFFRWSIRVHELPQFQIAGVITGLTAILAVLYIVYSHR